VKVIFRPNFIFCSPNFTFKLDDLVYFSPPVGIKSNQKNYPKYFGQRLNKVLHSFIIEINRLLNSFFDRRMFRLWFLASHTL